MKKVKEIKKIKKIEDYASVEAICGGVSVYSFSNLIYIYGQSPDFYPGVEYQAGNENQISKIELKKVWEIKNNYMGFCHEMTPRTRLNDSQPFLPVHLIDGDPETVWTSFEQLVPDAREEWIRIDLPAESAISKIKITCQKRYMHRDKGFYMRPDWHFGNALPKELSFKISCDAWHWDEVYNCDDIPGDSGEVTVELKKPAAAKQILITGKNFTKTGYEGYMFSINGVEVTSPGGRNLALISNGAGVTVSSTSDAHNSDRFSANSLWGPLQYDIGNKWTKFGSDNGSAMWCFTEHEKGVLKIDEDADFAITEAAGHGMKIMMTLDFKGNWAYESEYKKNNWLESRFKEMCESYICGLPLCDENDEMYEGYLNYISYMAGHFKERVEIFEIGNEWHGWKDNVNWYKNKIFEPTYERIKAAAPNAKICLCSPAGFRTEDILNCIDTGVTVSGGVLKSKNRMLAAVKNLSVSDVAVSVKSNCKALSGIVLRFKHKENFLAAVYDPKEKQAYFIEFKSSSGIHGNSNYDIISQCVRKAAAPAGNMGDNICMKTVSNGNKITFTVSDGLNTVSSDFEAEITENEGSAGFLHYPEETPGEFSDFKVTDNSGKLLFAGDFDNAGNMADKWDIEWNFWDDGKKPVLAARLDGIGWHDANVPNTAYFDCVKNFRKKCEKLGFSGEYFVNEIYAGAGYPPGPIEGNQYRLSDIREAKWYIKTMVGYSCLNIMSGPCHVHFTGFPHPQSVCRTTVPSQFVAPSQPKPSYYAIRNAATIMDDFYESEFPVEFSNDYNDGNSDNNPEIVRFTLESGDKSKLMVAAFLDVSLSDSITEKRTSLTILNFDAENIKSACVTDVFNGTEQKINFKSNNGGNVNIGDILLKDYPLFIILEKV